MFGSLFLDTLGTRRWILCQGVVGDRKRNDSRKHRDRSDADRQAEFWSISCLSVFSTNDEHEKVCPTARWTSTKRRSKPFGVACAANQLLSVFCNLFTVSPLRILPSVKMPKAILVNVCVIRGYEKRGGERRGWHRTCIGAL